MLDEKRAEIEALCREHGVVAAYVFGSLARGRDPARMNDRSDLDVALLLPQSWTEMERHSAATRFQVALSRLFGRGDVDVVVANDAPLALRHRITRERDILWGKETRERVFFDWSTWRDYRDMEPFRRIGHAAVVRRAREGRFGVRSGRSRAATP